MVSRIKKMCGEVGDAYGDFLEIPLELSKGVAERFIH